MKDYQIQLNERGEATIEATGNYISLVSAGAPTERYKVICTDSMGKQIVNMSMILGGRIKGLPSNFSQVRIINDNQGATSATLLIGVGDYEESGSVSGGTEQTELLDAVEKISGADGEVFTIPANDSRKQIHIQTGEFNADVVKLNGLYEMNEAEDFNRPIKNAIEITFVKAGDSIVYMEEV